MKPTKINQIKIIFYAPVFHVSLEYPIVYIYNPYASNNSPAHSEKTLNMNKNLSAFFAETNCCSAY
jgi:hypothetical protein